jgi:hypothetical protein
MSSPSDFRKSLKLEQSNNNNSDKPLVRTQSASAISPMIESKQAIFQSQAIANALKSGNTSPLYKRLSGKNFAPVKVPEDDETYLDEKPSRMVTEQQQQQQKLQKPETPYREVYALQKQQQQYEEKQTVSNVEEYVQPLPQQQQQQQNEKINVNQIEIITEQEYDTTVSSFKPSTPVADDWTFVERPAVSVRVNKRRTFSSINIVNGSRLLERVTEFRKLSRSYAIGDSSDGDRKFLNHLKSCATIEKRDNLMIPSSPVHRKPVSTEKDDSVFDNMKKKEQTIDIISPATPITHIYEYGEPTESNPCQISEQQLGFTTLQLKTSLPIPPGSIFLPTNEQAYVPKLMIKEKKHKKEKFGYNKDNSPSLNPFSSTEDEEELLSKLNAMNDKFEDKAGSRLSTRKKSNSTFKNTSGEILEPDCIGLLVR